MKEHRGRKPDLEKKARVEKLVQAGYSYQEIADALGLKSRQLARYHFKNGRQKLSTV